RSSRLRRSFLGGGFLGRGFLGGSFFGRRFFGRSLLCCLLRSGPLGALLPAGAAGRGLLRGLLGRFLRRFLRFFRGLTRGFLLRRLLGRHAISPSQNVLRGFRGNRVARRNLDQHVANVTPGTSAALADRNGLP